MIRKITFILIIFLLFTVSVFAQEEVEISGISNNEYYLESLRLFKLAQETFEYGDYDASTGFAEEAIRYAQLSNEYIAGLIGGAKPVAYESEYIGNNEYYLESLRLFKLAQETFEYGDYDASAGFAEEAIRYAQLSNEYVANRLIGRIKAVAYESENVGNNEFYLESLRLFKLAQETLEYGDYDASAGFAEEAIRYAQLSNQYIAGLIGDTDIRLNPASSGNIESVLPGQYTVRPWATHRDCLWNIAGYSWVYGDSTKWGVLYEANRYRMPEPNNPNLIEPGMILEIPSISGEIRQGMWDPNRSYERR
jgi:HEPN domain-containing protein